jgi:PD-(D/E)XK nuclease superfamily protein
MAELAFLYRAAREGIAVAKPWGASHPYDCLVQHKSRLLRVQVKSTFTEPTRTDPRAYQVVTSRRIHGKHCYYTREQVDFVATFVGTRDIWYIIPIEKIGTRRRVYLYPDGRKNPAGGIFEEFREAWHLLKGESPIGDISAASAEGAASGWGSWTSGTKKWGQYRPLEAGNSDALARQR